MNNTENMTKEQRILRMMRTVLGRIVVETTPAKGETEHPLTEQTFHDIKACFALISEREKELAEEHGNGMNHRPQYMGEKPTEKVVPMDSIK